MVMGIANLAMLTGNLGREGVGVNPLRGQNNVQGAQVSQLQQGQQNFGQEMNNSSEMYANFQQAQMQNNNYDDGQQVSYHGIDVVIDLEVDSV